MEIDIAAKIVALLIGVLGVPKLWQEISERRHARLKDQLGISKELVDSTKETTHPLIIQSAYSALTGAKPLHPTDIQRLMRLDQPLRAFRLFQEGQDFLRPRFGKTLPYSYKPEYKHSRKRNWLLVRFSVLYFVFAILAAAPLLFATQIFSTVSWYILLGLVAWAALCGSLAKIALDRFGGLIAAQKLVTMRLARSNNSFKPT